MAKRKKADVVPIDGKTAAAGEQPESEVVEASVTDAPDDAVFDGPLDLQQAMNELIELNHERLRYQDEYDDLKSQTADVKKELDRTSNAISLLIERIERQMNGQPDAQPKLRPVDEAPVGREATTA